MQMESGTWKQCFMRWCEEGSLAIYRQEKGRPSHPEAVMSGQPILDYLPYLLLTYMALRYFTFSPKGNYKKKSSYYPLGITHLNCLSSKEYKSQMTEY